MIVFTYVGNEDELGCQSAPQMRKSTKDSSKCKQCDATVPETFVLTENYAEKSSSRLAKDTQLAHQGMLKGSL